MVRSELVAKLVEVNPHLTPSEVEIVVKTIFDEIAAALSRGDRVELRGFGTLSVRQRAARVGRNPGSGAKVLVSAKCVPYFRTGMPMVARLNRAAMS